MLSQLYLENKRTIYNALWKISNADTMIYDNYMRCLSDKHFYTDIILGFAKKKAEYRLIQRKFSENIAAKALVSM